MKPFCTVHLYLGAWLTFALTGQLAAQRWSEMDYGPFLTSTLEVGRNNIACKSIAIRLDPGEGGVSQGNVFVSFDTDTLRYAAGWTGRGLMDWRSVVYDGSHGTHPSLVGKRVFVNPVQPGWGNPQSGSFDDTRLRGVDGRAYGPLDRQWGHWKGLYRHGHRVVLSYTVGSTEVLDSPGLEPSEGGLIITRSLQLGPRDEDAVLQVAQLPGCAPRLERLSTSSGNVLRVGVLDPDPSPDDPAEREQRDYFSFNGNEHLVVATADDLNLATADFSITAVIRTARDGTIFSKTALTGPWVPNGKTFFVGDGRLCYDIGWVGAVRSRIRIDDGEWHRVAATFEASSGLVRLYVDGVAQAERALRPKLPVQGHVARIGFTALNFPRPQSAFLGDIRSVRFYQCRLSDEELRDEDSTGDEQLLASWSLGRLRAGKLADATDNGHDALLARGDGITQVSGVAVACVGMVDPPWQIAADGSLQLRIPRGRTPLRIKLLLAALDRQRQLAPLAVAVANSEPPADLTALTGGGPALWPETLNTQVTDLEGAEKGPFVVETLTLPEQNPWRSWMRLGGFDFFSGGDRAAVCSWQGDVWLVDGLTQSSGQLRWRRIASGLFQPLGLKVVDDQIYVLGRDQITLLQDRNGDGESDFYQNFNNDMQVTEHFHEFAMDLQTDQYGDFYYMKAARHALPAVVPQHGTLIQVTRDGRQSRILARGFRAPDGLLVNNDGTFLTCDQEGHWTPMNRINWIRPGGFYGNMMASNPQEVGEDATDLPVCWIHRDTDRSPTAQVWVPRDHWGSLGGALLSLSYGTGKTFRVYYEEAGDNLQGGIAQLPIPEFPTGIQRGRFHPDDGMLYVCGLFGWSSDKTLSGGFYRVRYTGSEVTVPTGVSALRDGILLNFPQPLDPQAAGVRSNFRVSRWNYHRTANYGSADYRVSDGKQGRDTVSVSQVSVSRDRRSVFLHINDMTPCMQMRLQYRLRGAAGEELSGTVDYTVHVPKELDDGLRDSFEDGLAPPSLPQASSQQINLTDVLPGLALRIQSRIGNSWVDDSVVRTVALRTEPGQLPSLLAGPDAYIANWQGFIHAELPVTVTFQAQITGAFVVWVNEQMVVAADTGVSQDVSSDPVQLQAGLNTLRIRLTPLADGAAALRLLWQRGNDATELVRPDVLFHDPRSLGSLARDQQLRQGRELVAQFRCARCHAVGATLGGMPEMNLDLPSLIGIGDRISRDWLFQWIRDPQQTRNDITMPQVVPKASQQEIADIVAYLQSLRTGKQGDPAESEAVEGDEWIKRGLYLYEDLGCIACHHLDPPDFPDPYERTSLVFIGAKYRPGALIQFLRQPHEYYAGRRMPDFQLSLPEAQALSAYLRDVSQQVEPPPVTSGDVDRGKTAFQQRGCAACHLVEPQSTLPAPDQRPLFALPDTSRGCLARDDSQRAAAPQFIWDAPEREALIAFLQTDGQLLAREVPAEAAERFVQRLRCTVCHRRDGQLPRLPEILAEEGEQGHPAESLPPLTWTGEKLHYDWLVQLFSGRLSYQTRPWKRGRMPAFPAYADVLAHGLAAQHAVGTTRDEQPPVDQARVQLGKRLTEQAEGFNCLQCHGLPGKPPEAPFESRGIDFHHVKERLHADFYTRWISNPIQFDSAVPMPRFSADGTTTPVKTILKGDAHRQFDAIWQYLQTVADQ